MRCRILQLYNWPWYLDAEVLQVRQHKVLELHPMLHWQCACCIPWPKVCDIIKTKSALKNSSVKEPDKYIAIRVRNYTLPTSKEAWVMFSDQHIAQAMADVKRELERSNQAFRPKVTTPMSTKYRPELDKSLKLNAQWANYFQELIGILQWIIKLGHIDIMVAVLMLSCYLANPHVGHLKKTLHIFANLKCHDRRAVVFDHNTLEFDLSRFT